MSEEKLYAVKNDEGEYWDFYYAGFWRRERLGYYAVTIKEQAEIVADEQGGHVATFVEEPEKVKLPKKAAEWIDSVKDGGYDITYIFTEYAMPSEVSDWLEDSDDDAEHREERGLMLINAYVNGYTVAKEKKYYVKVPHTEDVWYYKGWGGKLETVCQYGNKHRITFTETEIEHYGLQDCEKEEANGDDAKTT